jgi:enolase
MNAPEIVDLRTAKYNRLVAIAEERGSTARYPGDVFGAKALA